MTPLAAHIHRVERLSTADVIRLTELNDRFVVESGDDSRPVGFHLRRVLLSMNSAHPIEQVALFVLRDGLDNGKGEIHGFAFLDVVRFAGVRTCYVMQGFIAPKFRRSAAIDLGFKAFEEWARMNKCLKMIFGTSRSVKAYERILARAGWKPSETYFNKDLGAVNG